MTPEEREQILSQIHQRETLERQALDERKEALRAETELQYRQALAEAARQAENERNEQIKGDLTKSLKWLEDALAAFNLGDEAECRKLLHFVHIDTGLVNQRLNQNQKTGIPTGVGLPTVRVKANNPQGWAVINLEDLTPAHQILEDSECHEH